MSFRNNSKSRYEWSRFIEAQQCLIAQTGLPEPYYLSQDYFEDFLMHGYIDHHEDPNAFTIEAMSEAQRGSLIKLVREFFRAGFRNPGGITVISADVEAKLEMEFPEAFK